MLSTVLTITGGVAPLEGDAPLDPLAGDAAEPLAGEAPLEPLEPPTLGEAGLVQVEKVLLA